MPGLAPSGELGPWSCYQRIAWSKANNVCPRHFSARGHRFGARAPKLSFWPIFREKPSPFGQPLHCVRISLACNSSLSLPIDAKFSHNVQVSTKSRKFRGSPNLGVKGGSHLPKFFFFAKMRFFEWPFEKMYF